MAQVTIIPAKDRSDEIIRTAAYARVSSDSQDQLNSFAAQIRYYTEMLQNSNNAVFVDMYADEGITGTSATKREDFQRLMNDCRKGKIDRILTKSVSRFARNTKDCLEAIRELKTLGVSVYFEKENIDTSELSSEMLLTLHSQFAQEESMSISKNVRMGFRKRMQDGSYVPSSVPFGYVRENGKLVINESEAEIVRNIFADYLRGEGEKALAAKYQLNLSTVKYILINEKYTGDSIFHKWYTTDTLPFRCVENKGEKEKYYACGTHPAIISKETFNNVQQLINKKGAVRRGKETSFYTLSKKIYCGNCGTLFKRKERSNGIYWVCRNHDESADKCPIRQIKETEFQAAFIRLINKLQAHYKAILNPMIRQLEALFEREKVENSQLAALRKEIAEIKQQIHLLTVLNSQGTLDGAYFKERSMELDRKLLAAQKQLHVSLDDQNSEQIAELRKLIGILEKFDPTTEFDEIKFGQIVEKIIVLSETEIRFDLIGGIGFTERIAR